MYFYGRNGSCLRRLRLVSKQPESTLFGARISLDFYIIFNSVAARPRIVERWFLLCRLMRCLVNFVPFRSSLVFMCIECSQSCLRILILYVFSSIINNVCFGDLSALTLRRIAYQQSTTYGFDFDIFRPVATSFINFKFASSSPPIGVQSSSQLIFICFSILVFGSIATARFLCFCHFCCCFFFVSRRFCPFRKTERGQEDEKCRCVVPGNLWPRRHWTKHETSVAMRALSR